MQPRKLTEVSQSKCTIGCPLLDKLLHGGIACGSVTELVGEASAGKTQACLQLLVTCQWPVDQSGLRGKAMYMYTEGDPSLKRLFAIMSASTSKASPDNIYWEKNIVDGEDLYERLQAAEVIMQQPQGLPLRLLIIDSIAHLFRDVGDHPDTSAYVHRTGMLFRISALLRRFADVYNLAVVITNQNGLQGVDNASIGFAQPQATGSRHTGTLSAKQQLSHTEAVMPSGTDAVLGCQHKHTGRHKLGKMQASPVGDNSLCPSNRVLTDPGSVQSASKKLACKLATGVFAPD